MKIQNHNRIDLHGQHKNMKQHCETHDWLLASHMKMLFLLGPFPTRRDVCHDDWALGFPEDGLPSRLVRGAPPWRRRCLRGSRGCGAGLRQRSGVRWAELWWARGLLVKWVKLVIEMRTNYRISWWLNGISWWLNGISWWLNGISWWLNGISWWLNGISWWLNGISWWLNGISWWLNRFSWWLNGISWWLNGIFMVAEWDFMVT